MVPDSGTHIRNWCSDLRRIVSCCCGVELVDEVPIAVSCDWNRLFVVAGRCPCARVFPQRVGVALATPIVSTFVFSTLLHGYKPACGNAGRCVLLLSSERKGTR
eukprot:1406015-Alexandrium_andersonii.AAC.1